MKFHYAILNGSFICERIAVYNQSLKEVPINYIPINKNDDVLYRKYENGQWSEEKYLPPEEPIEASLDEQIYAENLYQTALLEMQMLGGM